MAQAQVSKGASAVLAAQVRTLLSTAPEGLTVKFMAGKLAIPEVKVRNGIDALRRTGGYDTVKSLGGGCFLLPGATAKPKKARKAKQPTADAPATDDVPEGWAQVDTTSDAGLSA